MWHLHFRCIEFTILRSSHQFLLIINRHDLMSVVFNSDCVLASRHSHLSRIQVLSCWVTSHLQRSQDRTDFTNLSTSRLCLCILLQEVVFIIYAKEPSQSTHLTACLHMLENTVTERVSCESSNIFLLKNIYPNAIFYNKNK